MNPNATLKVPINQFKPSIMLLCLDRLDAVLPILLPTRIGMFFNTLTPFRIT